MDQRAGVAILVAADDPARLTVQAIEAVHASSDQHPVHGGAELADIAGDAVGPQ
jgi:hypothetical protein